MYIAKFMSVWCTGGHSASSAGDKQFYPGLGVLC